MGVIEESLMALVKEAFLTSGRVATNIAATNVKWDAENKTARAANAETWESTQMSQFQTFYGNKLRCLYAHGDRGQAQEGKCWHSYSRRSMSYKRNLRVHEPMWTNYTRTRRTWLL